MTGGKSRPKKDASLKVSGGQQVKAGQILSRDTRHYKAGVNTIAGKDIVAACSGKVYFSRKKTSRGWRVFINVQAQGE